MENPMSEPGGVGIAAFFKFYGLKVGIGMIGSALLYFVLPPVTKDGKFNQHEFVMRLICAGLFSCMFGDWAVQLLGEYWPRLHAEKHTSAVYLMVGAPGWWISRAIALWFQNRRDRDIGEVIKEVKDQ
jgi:hypothetical protein